MGHGTNHRQPETAGNPQFKRARLEEPLDDEQERTGEDDTSRISPEEPLMTKNPTAPTTSTSSILGKRQYDREVSFHQLPEGDVPLYQEAERVQWDEWVTQDQSKFIYQLRPQRFVSKLPGKDVCLQDLHVEIKTLVCWILPVTPCPKRQKRDWSFRASIALTMPKVW